MYGIVDEAMNLFYPTKWNDVQVVMYTVTYFLFDIAAVGFLVHIHHTSFKACSLESMKEFKNCCLLGERFVQENGCEVSRSYDGESEPDIN